MNNAKFEGEEDQNLPWVYPSQDRRIREIQELIFSSYWHQLHPRLREHWLNQLDELQRRH